MKFIETNKGHIAVSRIVRIGWDKHANEGHGASFVEYETGSGEGISRAETVPVHFDTRELNEMIPAQPGYFCIAVSGSEPYDIDWRMQIVGWVQGGLGAVSPVTPDTIVDDDDCAILCPDGQVIEPYTQVHANIGAYRASRIEEIKAEKARLKVVPTKAVPK